jgi:flagellar biosynthesis/type III secretory pathway protein FliH
MSAAPARILKNVAPVLSSRIPAAVHDADLRARERLCRAEEDARRIREAADAERRRVLDEAAEEGYLAGQARAAAALVAAEEERRRRLAALEREVVSLVLALAAKVLGRELAERPGAVADLAHRALAEVRERREVVLRVNPSDLPAIRAEQGRLSAVLARARLAVREDAGIAPGAAVVDTEGGVIDASIAVQLAHLGRALEEALGT